MKMNWQRHIHSGWRQFIGICFIVFGTVSAAFYYLELHTIAKEPPTFTVASTKTTNTPVTQVKANISPTSSPEQKSKVKLSIATQPELESLPKIGPTKAKAIIDYRNKYGFKTVNDLVKVKGIGPKTMEQLRPLVEL